MKKLKSWKSEKSIKKIRSFFGQFIGDADPNGAGDVDPNEAGAGSARGRQPPRMSGGVWGGRQDPPAEGEVTQL